jgi:monoamine oxidase
MPVTDEISALRQEILDLLNQQMAALDSPLGLSDTVLTDCYHRQERVQELRERLQTLSGSTRVVTVSSQIGQLEGDVSCAARPPVATAEVNARN